MVLLTGAFVCYYNYSATGNPMVFAYQQYQKIHGAPQSFYWQTEVPRPPGLEKYPDILAMYQWQLDHHNVSNSPRKLLEATGGKIRSFWDFYLQPAWTLPLLFLPFLWRDRHIRVLLAITAFVLAGVAVYPFFFPHYIAPLCGVILLAIVQCIRRLRLVELGGRPVGAFLAMGVVAVTVIGFLTPAGGSAFGSERHSPRSQVEEGLDQRPGEHLVLVRYAPQHSFHFTYVYNGADINSSHVVWARDLGQEKNKEILRYFKGRQAWIFLPDAHPPRLEPYQQNEAPAANVAQARQ